MLHAVEENPLVVARYITMKIRLHALLALVGILVLGACKAPPLSLDKTYKFATPELAKQWQKPNGILKSELLKIGKFRASDPLRRWAHYPRNHTALAVGSPDRCGYGLFANNQRNAKSAASLVDLYCHGSVRGLSRFAGTECKCQVAMVNDTIMVPPSAFRYFVAYKMEVREANGDLQVLLGTAELDGSLEENNSVRMLDQQGKDICTGKTDVGFGGEGKFSLSCPGPLGNMSGTFSVYGTGEKWPTAHAKGRLADGRQVQIVMGTPGKRFKKYAEKLAD